MRVGGNIKPPTKTKDVAPVYPEFARAGQITGVVVIEAIIDETGKVVDTTVLRGVPMLNEAAVDAVTQWEFTPTLLNGAPVPILMTLTVSFSLK